MEYFPGNCVTGVDRCVSMVCVCVYGYLFVLHPSNNSVIITKICFLQRQLTRFKMSASWRGPFVCPVEACVYKCSVRVKNSWPVTFNDADAIHVHTYIKPSLARLCLKDLCTHCALLLVFSCRFSSCFWLVAPRTKTFARNPSGEGNVAGRKHESDKRVGGFWC